MGTTLVASLGGIEIIVGILAGLLCGIITIFLFPLHVNKYTPSFMGVLAFLIAIFAFILPILLPFNLFIAMGFTFFIVWLLSPALFGGTSELPRLSTRPSLSVGITYTQYIKMLKTMGFLPSQHPLAGISNHTRLKELRNLGIPPQSQLADTLTNSEE
ncbi:MAG: hypothetical protein MUO64_11295 [Anaerolineales bacterium]|nr:hypothetical protein [Anaerolineales bacterium]